MVSGTLFTYPGSNRAYQVLVAAGYSGADVKVDPNFEYGKTNTSAEFLKKFPLGKVPAFEDTNGNCLSETNAIVHYVANEGLHGGESAINQALVQQYMSFADNEITPSACTWTFPTLGFKQYNKQDTEKAMSHIKKCLQLLNDLLQTRTFLVGERVTLADISLCCSMLVLYVQVLEPAFREPYGNVNRWFMTCINQPIFKKVLGDITLCTKMATFDNKKYNDLHPKEQKKVKAKAEKPKEEGKKPEAEADTAPVEKKKIDYFADVPKSAFVLDDWKKKYANNEVEVSYPYLWEHFDQNAWSFWWYEYKYSVELNVEFLASNMIAGFFQRVEGLRKHSHSIAGIYETTQPCKKNDKDEWTVVPEEQKNDDGVEMRKVFEITGCWLTKGTSLIFDRNQDWNVDAPGFTFTKLDPVNSKDDKLCVEFSFNFEGEWSKGRKPSDWTQFI